MLSQGWFQRLTAKLQIQVVEVEGDVRRSGILSAKLGTLRGTWRFLQGKP